MSIVVKSYNNDGVTFGVPPYYFRAFAVGGIPTITLAGSDVNALNWVVDQAVGSKLVLSMVDSNGSSGGIAPNLYDVIPGTDTTCLPSPPTSQFTVKPNISTTLTTCQPWGMTIKGGVQPYTVTLAALDSPIVTNVTLGPLDDVFTFIDRADPNTQLLAAVSDANGQYANGTGIVSTKGSTDVNCTGLVSSSGNSTQMAAQAAAEAAADKSSSRSHRLTSIIVGSVVGFIGLVLIVGAALWFLGRRREKLFGITVGQDTRPRLFEVEQAIPVTFSSAQEHSSSKALLSMAHPPMSPTAINSPEYPDSPSSLLATRDVSVVDQPRDPANNTPPSHYPSQFPANPAAAVGGSSSSQRRNKAENAYMRATRSVGEALRPTTSLTTGNSNAPNRIDSQDPLDPDIEPDIIIQHRDGGVVQELPPPYADRSAPRPR